MPKIMNVTTLRVVCREARKLGVLNTLTAKEVDALVARTERKEDTIFVLKDFMLHEFGDAHPEMACIRCWLIWSSKETDEPLTFDVPMKRFEKLPDHTTLDKLDPVTK
jgi:hypothetical protein